MKMVAEDLKVGTTAEASKMIAGRKLLVGMKLTTSCREMLTWTIAKLAQPGDHILAVHVSSLPFSQSVETDKEQELHIKQLASTLRCVLCVYESLCSLKQIKLQVEIVKGVKVKKTLVEVAKSYDASKLIVGTSDKHFSVGGPAALGKYCLKRLPSTCAVVILEQGEIIFDKKGTLGDDMARMGVLKVLRSIRSIGRSKKVASGGSEEPDDDPARPSVTLQLTISESIQDQQRTNGSTDQSSFDLDQSFGSCSSIIHEECLSSPISVLPSLERRNSTSGFEALRMSFSKRRAQGLRTCGTARVFSSDTVGVHHQRADMFLLGHDQTDADSVTSPETTLDSSSNRSSTINNAELPRTSSSDDGLVPGWPLLNHTIGFDKTKKSSAPSLDRNLSVVKWALQLPERGGHKPPLSPNSFAKDPFNGEHFRHHSTGHGLTLAQRVDCLCLDRPCTSFAYEELKYATSNFSPSNVVGRGGGSEVFKGEMYDGRLVAVKRLNQGPQAEEELLTDIEINTSLSHIHIVSLLGYCVDSSHLILVYDFLPEGNLEDHLHAATGKEAPVLQWEVRYKVAVGVAKALDHLHDGCHRPVIHRDVKASNILLTATFESQLSDFGLAKWAPRSASHIKCNDVLGTFGYLAPEYFMYGRVNYKTDVYAFGIVLLELITGRKPIDTTKPKGQENLVNWARPLLEKRDLDKLLDPRLEGDYNVDEMNCMILAAALCVRQSAQHRPRMGRILRLLCGDHGESPSISGMHEDTVSMDLEEEEDSSVEGMMSPKTSEEGETDFRTHLALAMLGVDGDTTSQGSVEDHCSVDLQHSSKYLEEYLEGRFSRSTSFND